MCRTAVELPLVNTECTRLARVQVSARVVGGSKTHSRSRSGGRRDGRGRDTTMVTRRVCVTVVTAYLALILVIPSRLTWKMATIFLVVVRVREYSPSRR